MRGWAGTAGGGKENEGVQFVLHCMGLNYVKCANNFSPRWILEDFGYVTVYKIALLLIPKLSLYQFFLGWPPF